MTGADSPTRPLSPTSASSGSTKKFQIPLPIPLIPNDTLNSKSLFSKKRVSSKNSATTATSTNTSPNNGVSVAVGIPSITPNFSLYGTKQKASPMSRINTLYGDLSEAEPGPECDEAAGEEDEDEENDAEKSHEEIKEGTGEGACEPELTAVRATPYNGSHADNVPSKNSDTEQQYVLGERDTKPDTKHEHIDNHSEMLIMQETRDLLNHRSKLLDDLHMNSSPQQQQHQQFPQILPVATASKPLSLISDPPESPTEQQHEDPTLNFLSEPQSSIYDFHMNEKQLNRIKNRAKYVESYLSTYYKFLKEYQTIKHFIEDGEPKYAGLEGYWNPLQIMRNRRIRMHKGEKIKNFTNSHIRKTKFEDVTNQEDLEWRNVKVASKIFSKKEKPKLIWHVAMNELIGDINWREDKWSELRDSNGKRRFKTTENKVKPYKNKKMEGSSSGESAGSNSVEMGKVKKMHELLFKDDKEEETEMKSSLRRKNENLAKIARFEHYSSTNGNAKRKGSLQKVPKISTSKGNALERMYEGKMVNKSSDDLTSEVIREFNKFCNNNFKIRIFVENSRYSMRTKYESINHELSSNTKKMNERLGNIEELDDIVRQKYDTLITQIDTFDNDIEKYKLFTELKTNRIEELLFYCDRVNSEINSSFSLKIRSLNEFHDKSLKIDNEKINDFFYKLIESLILSIFWIIWIVVEIWIYCKWGAKHIVNFIKWILI